jgi:DNA-binding SARP family transcriptional activator
MLRLRVRLFGRAIIEVNDRAAELTPTTTVVFIRLLIADGAPVTVDEIYRDIWPDSGPIDREGRTRVQRRMLEIRETVDPDNPGENSRVVRTERGRITAYRAMPTRDDIDIFQFIDLVTKARKATPDDKIALLQRALGLWSGPPLADVADLPWAAQMVRQLNDLRKSAMRDLMDAFDLVGRGYDALSTGEELSWETPGDQSLAASLTTLRDQLRSNQRKKVFREDFVDPDIAVVVMSGDLFAQEDANLVVGFCDTFDTDTDRSIVISSESVQGLLLHRLYGEDRAKLDRDLKGALSRAPKASIESRSAKRVGKLTRYPLGTVATLHHANRRIFGLAYSRMGNNLVAHSSLPVLRTSLENLWEAVYLHGQLKPVAMPLIGSGLSRIREASHDDLLSLIVRSFTASSRRRYLCPELRIIVPEAAFEKIRIAEILRTARQETYRSESVAER